MGRAVAGFLQRTTGMRTLLDYSTHVQQLAHLIGVQPYKIYEKIQGTNGLRSQTEIAGGLKALLELGQQYVLFDRSSPAGPNIARATIGLNEGTLVFDTADFVRLRFDLANGGTIRSATIHLLYHPVSNPTIWQRAGRQAVPGEVRALNAYIPVSRLFASMPQGIDEEQQVKLRIELEVEVPGQATTTVTTETQEITIVNTGLDLSTSTNTDTKRIENQILNLIHQNFPVGDGAWTFGIGSEYHNSTEFHAADINIAGTGDRDRPVYAVADGTIVISTASLTYGKVLINHPLPDGTQWQSEYLHMPIYERQEAGRTVYVFHNQSGNEVRDSQGNVVMLWNGKPITAGAQIGVAAGRGPTSGGQYSDTAFDNHVHFVAARNGESIDLRKVFEARSMQILATDGGLDDNLGTRNDGEKTFVVNWDERVAFEGQQGVYVNNTQHLIFDRSQQRNDFHDGRWIALHSDPNQRWEVKWDGSKFLRWDALLNNWYYENGRRKIWNPINSWQSES